jgi:hypothetical protein
MKRPRRFRSASTNFRVILAFTLCLAGLFLAVTAYGAWPALSAAAWIGAQKHAAYEARIDAKTRGWRGAPKSAIGSNSTGIKRSLTTSRPGTGTQPPTVTQQTNALGQTVYSISPSRFDISPPLTELAKVKVPARRPRERPELELPEWRKLRSNKPDPVVQVAPPLRDPKAPSAPNTAATGFNFDGIPGGTLLLEDAGYPPDTNGSVGNNQYVEMVNVRYQVWSLNRATKTATSVLGPVTSDTIWAGFGGECEAQNAGDPIVLYDKLANRWLLSQFTSAADSDPDPDPASNGIFYQCVAISKTADATGQYFRYAFAVPDGDFGDYPHYGVWTDAYYVMAHHFTPDENGDFSFHAASFGAMDRTKMLAGDPSATYQVKIDTLEGGHMPADLDGFAPPPAGAPGIFTSVHPDGMYLYRMKVDFSNAANTTLTLQAKMPIAPATAPCGGAGGQCIPQPNTVSTLDSLGDRLMFRLAYRNFIDHESLVVSHAVDPGVEGVVSGVRWYEFRISGQPDAVCGSYPCTYQQGTIADVENGRSRWMSSIAQDGAGNMMVGYTATGTAEPIDAHSIRYTGRAANHPLGTMTVPETIIQTGNRNVASDPPPADAARLGRWGDYASTSIDPADDCTFWHANEYYRQGQGANSNFDWSTRIASVSFAANQCQPSSCPSRPTSAPTIGTASAIAPNKIQVTWTAIAPAPGSYAIERKIGAASSAGLYEPLTFVPGSSTSFIDNAVQGGVTYSYRVIAATDARGRCQALVRSGAATATATGSCNLKPSFAGATSATSLDGPTCGVKLNWTPATASCPLRQIRYNVYRGTTPDFVPSAGNRVANCVPGPSSYVDTDALASGKTYYYVVRAEDNSTGNGGACGGIEESNNNVVAGTAYGPGTKAIPGTWTDGGGDVTSFLRLNTIGAGNSSDPAWRIIRTAEDPGANHTPGGDFAYRNAGPGPDANYGDLQCSAAETPVLTVGSATLNLMYWERHQFEKNWDGVAIEYSRNGGPWTDLPAPSNATADGCMTSDITGDYATLECTDNPPINACGFLATKPVITGPSLLPAGDCTTYMTGELTAYGRRCHRVTGLTPGDTIKFRWTFTSDPATAYKGFYLDDIAVTNIRLPNSCVPGTAPSPTPTATPAATPTVTPTATPTATPAVSPTATPTATPAVSPTATPTATPTVSPSATPSATPTVSPSATPSATPTVSPSATPSATPTVSPSATPSATPTATVTPTPTPAPAAQAVNLSTRMRVDLGDNAGIGGFIITGSVPKHVVIRAIGPSLTNFFPASELLADPTLELHGSGSFQTIPNNNWRDSQEAQIQASGLAPSNNFESAIDATLAPGNYTAIVRGNGTGKGIALVEVYDVETGVASKLANLSTRALVGTGSNVVIAGFILGNNQGNDRIVVRGLGPSLSSFGVPNPLQDPKLELRNENGTLLKMNNDWQDDLVQAAEITAAGLAPSNSKESAIAATLAPGLYTAILAGVSNTTGVGLVEVYDRGAGP